METSRTGLGKKGEIFESSQSENIPESQGDMTKVLYYFHPENRLRVESILKKYTDANGNVKIGATSEVMSLTQLAEILKVSLIQFAQDASDHAKYDSLEKAREFPYISPTLFEGVLSGRYSDDLAIRERSLKEQPPESEQYTAHPLVDVTDGFEDENRIYRALVHFSQRDLDVQKKKRGSIPAHWRFIEPSVQREGHSVASVPRGITGNRQVPRKPRLDESDALTGIHDERMRDSHSFIQRNRDGSDPNDNPAKKWKRSEMI